MDRRPLFAVGLAAFALIGAQQALYGPSFPALQARYGIGVGDVGQIVSAHFGGGLVGVLLAAPLLRPFGYRRLVAVAALAVAVGLGLVATAPAWWAALASAVGAGLGFGMLVSLLNLAFARSFGVRSTQALAVLNATFGVGAVLGPVPVAVALDRGGGAAALVPGFFGLAALAIVVGVASAATRSWPTLPPARVAGAAPVRWGLVAGFGVALAVYVALESNTAAWAPTHLALELDVGRAALATSAFWAAVTAGRLVVAALPWPIAPGTFVVGAGVASAAALGLAHVPGLGLVAYALVGFAVAPVFPATIAWLARVFPANVERVAPIVLAAGNFGPVAGAPIVGAAAAWAGAGVVPSVLLVLAATVVVLGLGLRRATGT
jgi:MFS transporter, FHS family, glucose/mannose:H+ symporter